ncbi:hypothetical protein, conserved [Trypanosoma brucei gambiense DAL972]|uniref:Uncharacterized protein n=1 Tax=Trypanosoma brucei gambiense (strain MHOM/CI/86/DAL972) TaxID=679716 RepID=D0A5K2_TRYB9|nr:hypothetical protein, conserved [Trypanosoma brucei gambiense DAL972]CBH16953.1 hypothetical protein, conserved [Trypanosoma brucei gambiense DAL972]|eukprot:XP_011779217.1 hypothetical protein, conserved [Trypanosoma brucei gambiense DAL972]
MGDKVEYGTSTVKSLGDTCRLVRALQGSTDPRLVSINSLLEGVVKSAQSLVKGTDSQKRFNMEFAEFCGVALMGLPDLEDAVDDLRVQENCANAAVNDQDDFDGISPAIFMREIIGYVVSRNTNVGAQYLEHIGRSAMAKFAGQESSEVTPKRLKSGMNDERHVQSVARKKQRTRPVAGKMGRAPADDKSGVAATGRVFGVDGDEPKQRYKQSRPKGPPMLSRWVKPWTLLNQRVQGIILEHASNENTRRPPVCNYPPGKRSNITPFDICTAPSGPEMLNLWHARESMTSSSVGHCDPVGVAFDETALDHDSKGSEPSFFPSGDKKVCAFVSSELMANLVRYGVSSLEAPFKGAK